jgi:O-antigen/teichoic acid export membrane protein
MIVRNVRLIFSVHVLILLCGVVTSLLGAWALGPAGRGDLLVVVLWPPVVALLAGLGLPQAHRYWMAKEPERLSTLFSNAIIYTVVAGGTALVLAEMIVPHLVGQRSPEVMTMVRIYLVNIPAALLLELMVGLLEGARRFGWAGAARTMTFGVQALGFLFLWFSHRLTVESAALTMIVGQTSAMLLSLVAVGRQLRPAWQPSWTEWRRSMSYGLRDFGGIISDFTTMRLDQLLLGGMASSAALGLYVIAVRLSEMTTMLAGALADALLPEVAATARTGHPTEQLLGRSLRLTIYSHLIVLVPLLLATPLVLRKIFGENFLPAAPALRWLLIAATVWSAGAIVISGLQGLGHPGLSTIARLASAAVTVVGLLVLLPRLGITGAAIASLVGYSVMFVVALLWLVSKQRIGLWECLRPRREDIPDMSLRSLARLGFPKVQNQEI